jgi:TPR repeat protein
MIMWLGELLRTRVEPASRDSLVPHAARFVLGVLWLVAILASGYERDAQAASQHALVIGNDDYPFAPLENPINDARAVAGVLSELGFHVTLLESASLEEFRAGVHIFTEDFTAGDTALFYYAGHGVQYRGVNYLLPVDLQLEKPEDLPERSIVIDEVIASLDQAGAGMTMVILDACRDNPFGAFETAFGDGLAKIERAPGQTLIAYATAAGDAALDGTGGNSPFTAALVSVLDGPEVEIFDLFRQVRARVREATDGLQLPWISSSLERKFYFRRPGDDHSDASTPSGGEITVAGVLWEEIRRSKDPLDFERFLDAYPRSPMVPDARDRLQKLRVERATSHAFEIAEPVRAGSPNSLASFTTSCDLAAADSQDPDRVAPGVPSGIVNTRFAINACALALSHDPHNSRLLFQLGRALGIAAKFREAHDIYMQSAQLGYSAAMSSLGFLYLNGLGVARDLKISAEFYTRAALSGNPYGRIALARAFHFGWGVEQSDDEARQWLDLSVSNHWPEAMDNLARYYLEGWGVEQDLARAFDLYRRAADLGHAAAMDAVGLMYYRGQHVEQDYVTANRWFMKAFERGNRHGTFHLALAYLHGRGMPKDSAEALRLFELAAERGFPLAHTEIGIMHRAGLGVPVDLGEALFRYRIASAMGDWKSKELLPQLLSEVSAEVRAAADARAHEWLRLVPECKEAPESFKASWRC